MENELPTFEDDSTGRVSTDVVTAVAEARDVEPTELPPLYDVIDPDALDGIFRSQFGGQSLGEGRITFTLAGCEVVVESDGGVTATPFEATERDEREP